MRDYNPTIRLWFLLFIFKPSTCACMISYFSRARLSVTPRTVAHQAPLSMGFSRQEYWRGLPSPPPGDLLDSGIEPESLMSPALAGKCFTISTTWKALPSI